MDTIKQLSIQGVFICAALLLSTYLFSSRPEKEATNPADHESVCNRIAQKKPDVIFVGNSILDAGLDQVRFTKATGFRTLKLTAPGSASAWWYVVTKNVVARCAPKPKVLAIVFRDTFLTVPDYRVSGKYRAQIDRFADKYEPVLRDLAYFKTDSKLDAFLSRHYPPYHVRSKLKKRISREIRESIEQELGFKTKAVTAALKKTFADKKYNRDLLTKSQLAAEKIEVSDPKDFDDLLARSFLPHIIAETEKAEIQLVLIRAKRRKTTAASNDSEKLTQYLDNLRAYLHSRNVPLWDYSSLSEITRQHYRSGDHLGREGQEILTDHIAADFMKYAAGRNSPM